MLVNLSRWCRIDRLMSLRTGGYQSSYLATHAAVAGLGLLYREPTLYKQAAFSAFYQREFQHIFKAVVGLVLDESVAYDITQEAFTRTYARWSRLWTSSWIGGWTMTTAVNLCRKELGRARREVIREQPGEPPLREAADLSVRLDLLSCLRLLPRRQREVAMLFYLLDLPIYAVASVMGISEGGVKAHLSKARSRLREVLIEQHQTSAGEENHGGK